MLERDSADLAVLDIGGSGAISAPGRPGHSQLFRMRRDGTARQQRSPARDTEQLGA